MILIADEMHPALMEELTAAKIPFNYQPDISITEAIRIIPEAVGLVIRSKFFIDKHFIDRALSLRFIARAGSGTDNIDADYAETKDIKIINAPEALSDSVAEHTIGLILALQHKIANGNQEVKNRIWNREGNRGFELMGSTLGIIGYGHTGSAVARKLSGFGLRVLAYDKYKTPIGDTPGSFFFDAHATSSGLQSIYEQSDILTLHIPLTNETRMWVDKKFFDQFKKPIVFINTSRGKIVSTTGLLEAIAEGKVKAAGLDVMDTEPPFQDDVETSLNFAKLKEMENVILTPHVAGWSVQSYKRISTVLGRKIIEFHNKLGK